MVRRGRVEAVELVVGGWSLGVTSPSVSFSSRAEEVVHARNVIALFVWAWPSVLL